MWHELALIAMCLSVFKINDLKQNQKYIPWDERLLHDITIQKSNFLRSCLIELCRCLESWCLLCHKMLWLLVGVFYSQLFVHACYSLSYQCLLAVSTCCIEGLPSFLAMVMDHKKEKIHVFSGFLRFVGNQFKIKMVGKLPFLVGFFAFKTCDLSLRSFGQWLEVTFETDI